VPWGNTPHSAARLNSRPKFVALLLKACPEAAVQKLKDYPPDLHDLSGAIMGKCHIEKKDDNDAVVTEIAFRTAQSGRIFTSI
jgi:hypothetical protein